MRSETVFSGTWGIVKAAALLLLIVVAGVWQWSFLQSRRDTPLYGSVRVMAIPRAAIIESCADWRTDAYVENNTAYPIKLRAYRFTAEIAGETIVLEEREAPRAGTGHLLEIAPGDAPRIAHLADGCAALRHRTPPGQAETSVVYRFAAETSDGNYSGDAAAVIAF